MGKRTTEARISENAHPARLGLPQKTTLEAKILGKKAMRTQHV